MLVRRAPGPTASPPRWGTAAGLCPSPWGRYPELGPMEALGRSLGRCPGSFLTGRAIRGFKSVHSLPHPLPHSINIPVPLLGIISQVIHTCLSLELSLVGIQVSHAVPQCGVKNPHLDLRVLFNLVSKPYTYRKAGHPSKYPITYEHTGA